MSIRRSEYFRLRHTHRLDAQVFYAIMLLVYLTFGIVKISALLFYKRIFTEPRFNLAANIMMAAVVSWTIVQFIVSLLPLLLSIIIPYSRGGRFNHSILGIRPDFGISNFWTTVPSTSPWLCWTSSSIS